MVQVSRNSVYKRREDSSAVQTEELSLFEQKVWEKTGLPVPTPTGRMAGRNRPKGVQFRAPNPAMLSSGLINSRLGILDTVQKIEEISTYAR